MGGYPVDDDDLPDELPYDLDEMPEYDLDAGDAYDEGGIDLPAYVQDALYDDSAVPEPLQDHYRTVQELRRGNRYDLACVVLAPFFESALSTLLDDGEHGFAALVEAGRDTEVLPGADLDAVDDLRSLRNDILHRPETGLTASPMTMEETVEDAHAVYRDLIGAEGASGWEAMEGYDVDAQIDELYSDFIDTEIDLRPAIDGPDPRDAERIGPYLYDLVRYTASEGRDGVTAILTNTFYEMALERGLEQFLERHDLDEDPVTGVTLRPTHDTIAENTRYLGALATYYGLLSPDEYGVVRRVQEVRNRYAHDLAAYTDPKFGLDREEQAAAMALVRRAAGTGDGPDEVPASMQPDLGMEQAPIMDRVPNDTDRLGQVRASVDGLIKQGLAATPPPGDRERDPRAGLAVYDLPFTAALRMAATSGLLSINREHVRAADGRTITAESAFPALNTALAKRDEEAYRHQVQRLDRLYSWLKDGAPRPR